MRMRAVTRVLLVILAAVVFGAVMSVVKGNGAGVRDGVGNLSAPWVIAPLLAGATAARGRIVAGALIGLLTTAVALVGFYLANSFVLDLGPHSTFHDLGLTLDIGTLWFKAGAVSGPVMGAAGAWASRRGRFTVAAIVIATVVLEPVAVYLAYLTSNGLFAAGDGQWNGIYAAECIVGLVAAVVLLRARGVRRRSSTTS
jgi:hypothetical protein